MDYFLSRTSSIELLEKKKADPNVANIPVIMASTKIDRQKLVQVSKYNVKKFFTKPIRIDSLLKTVSELLGVEVTLDDTPCIIEAHFNDEILFIEVADGLNKEKIELLRYKLMMVGVDITANDSLKLATLLNTVIEYTRAKPRDIKILTNNDFVTRYVGGNEEYKDIEITNALDKAITSLLGGKAGDVMRLRILGPDGREVFAHDADIADPKAQLFRAAGTRVRRGLMPGTYQGEVTLIRDDIAFDRMETTLRVD